MPDGDIVHNRLRTLYQRPYKWLCEGNATSDECSRALLESLKRDLIQKGDLPIRLCQSMADMLDQALTSSNELGSRDYADLSMNFDKLVQQSDGRPDLKELALRAGKSVICDLRYGQKMDIDNLSFSLVFRYINEVYESEFKECIPLTFEHHAGIDQVTLSERIKEIEPKLRDGISKFSKDAINKQSIANLSLPRRFSHKRIDLDENLLAG
ncbi:MAG: hypothetical protein ACAF42_15365 [Limnothrix sp. BL-A-16]